MSGNISVSDCNYLNKNTLFISFPGHNKIHDSYKSFNLLFIISLAIGSGLFLLNKKKSIMAYTSAVPTELYYLAVANIMNASLSLNCHLDYEISPDFCSTFKCLFE